MLLQGAIFKREIVRERMDGGFLRLNGCENNDSAIFLEYFASHGHPDNREQNKHRNL